MRQKVPDLADVWDLKLHKTSFRLDWRLNDYNLILGVATSNVVEVSYPFKWKRHPLTLGNGEWAATVIVLSMDFNPNNRWIFIKIKIQRIAFSSDWMMFSLTFYVVKAMDFFFKYIRKCAERKQNILWKRSHYFKNFSWEKKPNRYYCWIIEHFPLYNLL